MAKEILLDIQNLSRSFGGLKALDNVSFQVQGGLIQAVIGPNGAGKTTLFNCISGRLKTDHGSMIFKEQALNGLKPFQIARLGIACTFQTTRLFPEMTVLENVMVGRHICSHAGFFSCLLQLPGSFREEKEIRRQALRLLQKFDL
jgi:branched-chain amino acid transport system ATP-binding protein